MVSNSRIFQMVLMAVLFGCGEAHESNVDTRISIVSNAMTDDDSNTVGTDHKSESTGQNADLRTLIVARTEAEAQISYFRSSTKAMSVKLADMIRSDINSGSPEMRPLSTKTSQDLITTQTSQCFWQTVSNFLNSIINQYERIRADEANQSLHLSEMTPIQEALSNLAVQVNRAAKIAFNDVIANTSQFSQRIYGDNFAIFTEATRLQQLPERGRNEDLARALDTLSRLGPSDRNHSTIVKITALIKSVESDQQTVPATQPHFRLDDPEFAKDYSEAFRDDDVYNYYKDLVGLIQMFKYLASSLRHPPDFSTKEINFPYATRMWIDTFFTRHVESMRVRRYDPSTGPALKAAVDRGEPVPVDGTLSWTDKEVDDEVEAFLRPHLLSLDSRVQQYMSDRTKNAKRNKARRRRRQRAQSSQGSIVATKGDGGIFKNGHDSHYEVLSSHSGEHVGEPSTDSLRDGGHPQSVSLAGSMSESSVVDEEFVYDSVESQLWIDEQIRLSLAKRSTHQRIILEPPGAPEDRMTRSLRPQRIELTGRVADVYRTAMGMGASQVRHRDLEAFLRAVGGGILKPFGPKSDSRMAMPNFSESSEPFVTDRMHFTHSGREVYPEDRLRTHLARLIDRSGLPSVVTLE